MNSFEDEDRYLEQQLEGIEGEDDVTFGHAYMPYSSWRIKEVFLNMGIELRPYYTWYKAMRYRSCQSYVLVELYTNEIIGDERGYTLEELRCFLAKNNVPLHSEIPKPKKNYHKNKRRQGCVKFLEVVENLKEGDE